jgi:hypothetical protein
MGGTVFYLKLKVEPSERNPQVGLVSGAYAHCWILDSSDVAAYNKALFYIAKGEWTVVSVEEPLSEVTIADFEGRDIGAAKFHEAREKGIAIVYVAWSRDGVTTAGPTSIESPQNFDLNAYIGRQKKLSKSGRCLHFESGEQCGQFIGAHSIQKRGQLSAIAENGCVYVFPSSVGSLKKNRGRLVLEKRGIGKVSTFAGFCDKHDNQLFAPIDKEPLLPNCKQAWLYAYRSICREVFVKQNALRLIEAQVADIPTASSLREHFERMRSGTAFGLRNLLRHKEAMDASSAAGSYTDTEYALFTSSQVQFLAFSGLIYPEFDFQGRLLQELADSACPYELLTFCSAPTANGWGYLFAWHVSSAAICRSFIRSLATAMHDNLPKGADAMFRLVISNCENLAIAPKWWEARTEEQQLAVIQCLERGVDIFASVECDYLCKGAEGICQWEFDGVFAVHR